MKFKLTKTIARQFSITLDETGVSEGAEKSISIENMHVSTRTPDDDETNKFAISFDVSIKVNVEEVLLINIEYWAFFEADQALTEAFLNGHFTSVNAPAIAFPYLRSFVTNVLVNAGYPAVYLPTINFVELAKKEISA